MRGTRRAVLLAATALVGLGLILLLTGGTAFHGGAALGMLAAGWWGIGLIPVHATARYRRRRAARPAGPPAAPAATDG
ncbi:hypothetical protein ACIQBJ_31170 [Kitasatospora sp. NPDC088391]|uniref:hypothetical protein n=1 Tax=Kitasatospora sp. NPDC088391 TaxID=3364074 RepID=UPI0037FDD0FF